MQDRKAPTSKVGIIDLDIPDAHAVQQLQLLLVRLRHILEVLLVRSIDLLGKGTAGLVPEVVPAGGDQGNLDVLPLALGELLLHDLNLTFVAGMARVADLANADGDSVGYFLGLEERLDVWCVGAEHGLVVALQDAELELFHAVELLKKGTPEHVSAGKWSIN